LVHLHVPSLPPEAVLELAVLVHIVHLAGHVLTQTTLQSKQDCFQDWLLQELVLKTGCLLGHKNDGGADCGAILKENKTG
jgi:hypothetical protein